VRALVAGVASVLLIALLAGCAAAGSQTVTVAGKSLTVYLSVPPGVASDPVAQDVVNAEQLAFSQKHEEVSGFTLGLVTLRNGKLSDHARTAISDTKAIAYLGEVRPGDSANTLGITNAQDLLQVAPTDTALELTQATPAIPNTPGRYYESLKTYGRTFARVVPNTAKEAKAQLQEMSALGVKRLYVTDDGSDYGKAIAQAVRGGASGAGLTVASAASGADGAFVGAADPSFAARTFASLAGSNPSLKLFGPSAVDTPALVSGLASAPGNLNLYVSSPGFLTGELNPDAQKFVADFRAAYGHPPAPSAIFGYEAMAAVLDVLHGAGSAANNRATVVKDFFGIRNRSSVLGTYSIAPATGDTNLGAFVFSRLSRHTLVPFKSVTVQG
jgi:ABC-type branched-subunit amino acid transport system substrate-binding protein